jgi:hypothetical protein
LVAVVRFATGFFVAMVIISLVSPHVQPAAVFIYPTASSFLTGLSFSVTALIRHGLSRRYLRETSHWVTVVIGACTALIPLGIYVLLLGRTETFPWVATAWLAAVVAAPFVVYPERDVD